MKRGNSSILEVKRRLKAKNLFRPKDIREQIRYYYKKYLSKLDKKGIDIIVSDTSLDINIKAEKDMDKEVIDGLRDIYIEARYGICEVDKTKAEKMKKLYKKV